MLKEDLIADRLQILSQRKRRVLQKRSGVAWGAEPTSHSPCFRHEPLHHDPTPSPTDLAKLISMTFDISTLTILRCAKFYSTYNHQNVVPSASNLCSPFPDHRHHPTLPEHHNMSAPPLYNTCPLYRSTRNLHPQLHYPLRIRASPSHLRRKIHILSNRGLHRPTTPCQHSHFSVYVPRK
jgi:hypothetical protein